MLPSLSLFVQAVSAPFKRSQLGLFHGKSIQFGNNVPFSKHKTRRTWLPNIQSKVLKSELLRKNLRVTVTTKALKTVKKYGGLDEYILKTRHELLGSEGMRIRILLREKAEANARRNRARMLRKEESAKAKEAAIAQMQLQEIAQQEAAQKLAQESLLPQVRMLKLEKLRANTQERVIDGGAEQAETSDRKSTKVEPTVSSRAVKAGVSKTRAKSRSRSRLTTKDR